LGRLPRREGRRQRHRASRSAGLTTVRISITVEAFDAIAETLPLGNVMCEQQITAKGERWVLASFACRQQSWRRC
jgi:hypothetical protein